MVDIELIDVYDEDVDATYDDYKLGMYDADEEEDCKDYDKERINNYFYGS